jgi:SAM-dependent methyltransferase
MRTSLVDAHAAERLLLLVGALRSGLVDALASADGLSVGQVANIAGTDVRASGIVLEALASEEVVERVSGRGDSTSYRLSPLGRAHLVDAGPDLERSGLLHQGNKLRGWLELSEVIRAGKPATRGPRQCASGIMVSAMGERDPAVLDEIVERCFAYAGTIRTMIDVGGAVGHLARHFSRRGVKANLLDREEILPVAREFLGDEGGDIELIGGDYTVSLPVGTFDLVYFGNVYHIYGPETNARVTREALSITAPGGTIAIQDYVWDRSSRAPLFAVNMLRATEDGGVWTEAEYRTWLSDAGFAGIETIDLETSEGQLILAKRPRGL